MMSEVDEKDLEEIRKTIKYLKYERKKLYERIKTIDETLDWISKAYNLVITE